VITARAFAGKRYAVLGLARSGAATVRSLVASGAHVIGWDESGTSQRDLWEQLKSDRRDLGIEPGFVEKNWLLAKDLTGYEAIVVSPGVPINRHPVAEIAKRYGVPLVGDIELFAQARPELPPHKVVGITGTNGKSTTTALVHHILKTAGVPTAMGGNIGLPILAQDPLPEGGVYVLELSSYQIDLTESLDCDVAVLTNITPDHLDRYRDFDDYVASKLRLFSMQSRDHPVVANFDLPSVGALSWQLDNTPKAYLEVGTYPDPCGISVFEGSATIHTDEIARQEDWPSLQGPHNAQNAALAIAVANELGLSDERIAEGLRTYPGLPHRMERIREREGVLFVNDSKGTNPDSTAPALAAYPQIHWIVGGRAKTESLGPCEQHLDHVRGAYTIGEAGSMFARLLAGKVPVTVSHVLERAVTDAAAAAKAGEVVLLSPACSSFDQYRDFEARGEAFRAAVEAL
jgi:UDP-N-acetylmuramoylalanine--D-glutamate ligase